MIHRAETQNLILVICYQQYIEITNIIVILIIITIIVVVVVVVIIIDRIDI